MKNFRHSAIAYERSGPLSDMFVPHAVTLASPQQISRRGFVFVLAALLIAAVPTFFLPGGTLSYFSDVENSIGNTFAAGPLDFSVASNIASTTLIAGQVGQTFGITVTPGNDSLPFLYSVSGSTSGSAPFCAAITASGSAPLSYSGAASAIFATSTSSLAPWSLVLTLPAGAPGVVDGQICILNLTYQAYQQGGVVNTEYHDTEHVILTITADPPVASPVIQDALTDLNQDSTDTSSTSATSGDPALPPVASTTEDVASSTPDTASSTPAIPPPPPADNTPPSDGSTTPPTDPVIDPAPADTSSDTSTPDPSVDSTSTDTAPDAPTQ